MKKSRHQRTRPIRRKAMTTAEPQPAGTGELTQELVGYINAARNERFEDGMESRFSERVRKSILSGGADAVRAWAHALAIKNNAHETTEEFLRIIGNLKDQKSHEKRREVLTGMLRHGEPAIRDAAGLGLAALDDPTTLPALKEALDLEPEEWVRKGLRQVAEQLAGE